MAKKLKKTKPQGVKVSISKKIIKNQDTNTWDGLFNYWTINHSAKYPYFFEWLKQGYMVPKKAKE